MSERVYPREAMTAEGGLRTYANEPVTRVTFTAGRLAYYDDAEFVAAFRPASDLDELIAAARPIEALVKQMDGGRTFDLMDRLVQACREFVEGPLRRWDGDQ